jgi:hypothetical protein
VNPVTEYATKTTTTNPILNPTMYWRVSAFALAAVAVLGTVMNLATSNGELVGGFLEFDWTHNVVHYVLAAAAFIFGFANLTPTVVRTFAIVFGFVYAGLGILGFVIGNGEAIGPLGLELGENLIHLLLGAWGLLVGFMSK